jgi:hypothetical protein
MQSAEAAFVVKEIVCRRSNVTLSPRRILLAALWLGLVSPSIGLAQTSNVPPPSSAAAANGPSLLRLFPELSNLDDAKVLRIVDSWVGLSPKSPAVADYPLALKDTAFVGEAVFSENAKGGRKVTARRNIAIPRGVIQTFLRTVLQVPLEEKAYRPRINHTDDYPTLLFEVATKRGQLRITSSSQAMNVKSHWSRAPWAIIYANRTFVVSTTDIDFAIDPLYAYLKKD